LLDRVCVPYSAVKTKTVFQSFPHFSIDGHCLQFVNEYRYLGHRPIINNNLCDDADIKREIHIMYVNSEIQKVFTTCKDSDI